MTKNSKEIFNYAENKKNFKDEIKNIYHHFERVLTEANKIVFLKGKRRNLRKS